jgi:hypothetical protein
VHDGKDYTPVPVPVAQKADKVCLALRHPAGFRIGLDELLDHLVLQLIPVNNDQNCRLLQLRMMPELLCCEEDGQALAAPLGVPHESPTPFLLAVQFQGATHDLVSSSKLLITSNLLDRSPFLRFKDNEIPNEIK